MPYDAMGKRTACYVKNVFCKHSTSDLWQDAPIEEKSGMVSIVPPRSDFTTFLIKGARSSLRGRGGSGEAKRVDSWYHKNIKIEISLDCCKMSSDLQFDDIMGHELVHARDLCRKDLHSGNCEETVCSEMQAYIINVCFMYSGEKLRRCLLERVPASANKHCRGKDVNALIIKNFNEGKCVDHALL